MRIADFLVTTPSEFLKNHTRQEHQSTELGAGMQRLVAPDLGCDEYTRIQSRFLGVFAPLEQSIALDPIWDSSGIARPARANALQADLHALGADLDAIRRADVRPVDELGWKLGRIYVLEGSRLGGRMIRKALTAHAWYQDDVNGRFLADGEPDRWHRVKRLLDDSLGSPSLLDSAASSAANTFCSIRRWMSDDA